MSLNKLEKKLNKGAGVSPALFTVLVALFHKGTTALMTLFFTWFLNSSEYGDYSVFNSWMGIITVLVTLQLYYGVYTQGLVKFEDNRDAFSASMQGLNLFMCIAWLCVCAIGYRFWGQLIGISASRLMLMFAIIWSNASYEFWATEQRVLLNYKKLFRVVIFEAATQLIICTFCVMKFDNKADGWIVGIAISQLAVYIFLFAEQISKGNGLINSKYWKYALCFNIPLIPHYLSQIVLNSSDRIMINDLVGPSEAGIYSYAYHVAMIMTMLQTAILSVVNPWIYKQIKEENEKAISEKAYFLLKLVAIGNLVIILIAPELIHMIAPVEYSDAIWIIPPVSMGCFFTFVYCLFADFSFYYQKTFNIMIASVAGAILNVFLNYMFIPRFGYIAAGYTTLACYIIYDFLHYCFMLKLCNVHHGNQRVYDPKILVSILGTFIVFGFINLIGYKFFLLRFFTLIIIVLYLVFRRGEIIKRFKEMILLK